MRLIVSNSCLAMAAALTLLSGCRVYGSQASRDLLLRTIDETVLQVDLEGAQWQQDAVKLAGASDLNPDLQLFADQAGVLALELERLAERLQALGTEIAAVSVVTDNPGARWLGPDRYRQLHRIYGSMVTERQHLINRRAILARDLGTRLGLAEPTQPREEGRYQIVPHHYHQFSRTLDLTDVLAQLGQAAIN